MTSPPRTFLFTDIEGSYRQWERHPRTMPHALAEHDAILERAVAEAGGRIFKTVGDAVCAVFDSPIDGVRAAVMAQRALSAAPWAEIGLARPLTVRMALQSGESQERDGDFTGLVLNRISRLMRAGHGGQVLLSLPVASELERNPLPGVGLRDLGERRLRDVPGAHRIYQLEIDSLPTTFPPLKTIDTVAHNLPVALNTCIDREAELAEIRRLVLDSPARLVTLIGPGGIGKTRLVLHVAMQLIDTFSGGIWFVDLSGVRDADSIAGVAASALGVRIDPGSDPVAAIAAHTGECSRLLVLDNCEQIVDGVAAFVSALLPQTTDLRVLATSRVPLQIRGEQRVEIGPLPVEAGELAGPAVQLFLERAQQMRPAFELTDANRASIFEICHRVDGIPLALELAAARLAVLSPEALRNRLNSRLTVLISTSRDLPERHRTLRAAIAWSYALLTEEEQRVFRLLSVFQRGWTFAAAQSVLGLDELAAMEALASLQDKSLILIAENGDSDARYSMLETIQEFGLEQLEVHEELRKARSMHAAFYSGLVSEASEYLEGGPLQRHWFLMLDREISNIRAALQGCLDLSDAKGAIDLCIDSWGYWSLRGLASEGQKWFQRALSLATDTDPALRARAFSQLGNLCVERGELLTAESLYRAALEIERNHQNRAGIANSLVNLGMVSGLLGRMPDEYELQQEALVAFRELGDTRGVAISLFNLAFCARNHGRPSEALRLLDEVAELQIELRDDAGIGFKHELAARIHKDLGALDSASDYIDAAARVFLREQMDDGLYLTWMTKASVELAIGRPELASSLIDQAIEGFKVRGEKAYLASAFEIQAQICAQLGVPERGAALLGEAYQLRERTSAAIAPVDLPCLTQTRNDLQEALGDRLFSINWEQGRLRLAREEWAGAGLLSVQDLIGTTLKN